MSCACHEMHQGDVDCFPLSVRQLFNPMRQQTFVQFGNRRPNLSIPPTAEARWAPFRPTPPGFEPVHRRGLWSQRFNANCTVVT